jgi:predicted Zn finger-like uncharacterized protein
MSLITRCPACRTMFRLVPDQLKISEGWVRCGKCEEIFDAAAHLQELAEPAPQSTDVPGVQQAPAVSFQGELAAASPVGAETVLLVEGETRESSTPIDPSQAPLLPEGSAYGTDASPPLQDEHGTVSLPEPAAAAAAGAGAGLSFMQATRPRSRWHRPLVRASLMVACLVLLLALGAQVLIQERDRLVALHPDLRPLVEEICLLAGCEIRPLRQIESVAIDSSAFSKVKGDLYRLSVTLKNNAPIDVAMPAVELALTDTLDHALIRRVLTPEDLGARSAVIPAASESQATVLLTVKTNGNGERIAGYRLLAFYP